MRDSFNYPKPSCKNFLSILFCGICMGIADLIPGISGGTIAFLMGFYTTLIESLKSLDRTALVLLLSFRFRSFFHRIAWPFLLPLLCGILIAFISFASLINVILQHEVYRANLYAAFMGFILASFFFCIRQIRVFSWRHFIGVVVGAVVAYMGTTFKYNPEEQKALYAIKMTLHAPMREVDNYDQQRKLLTGLSSEMLGALLNKQTIQPDTPIYDAQAQFVGYAQNLARMKMPSISLWLILCGMIAISAMLLPGISGSYLLSILGVYSLVIGALADFISQAGQFAFDGEAFAVLGQLALGIIMGLLLFTRCISWLLRKYPHDSIALLSGCMLGALPSIWPFWAYSYQLLPLKLSKGVQLTPLEPVWPSLLSMDFLVALGCIISGWSVVVLIERQAKVKNDQLKPLIDR